MALLGAEAEENAQRMAEHLETLPSGNARACMWTLDDDLPGVIYLVEDAKEIAEHLKEWSEGKPGDWFSFHYMEKGEAYATALMPNFYKSAERWKIAFQLRHGYPPPKGGESHLFRPLHSVAPGKTAFLQVRPYIRDRVNVSLVDASEVTPQNWMTKKDSMTRHDLGVFKAFSEQSKTGIHHGWLEDTIDTMLKDEG